MDSFFLLVFGYHHPQIEFVNKVVQAYSFAEAFPKLA